jgi:protease I
MKKLLSLLLVIGLIFTLFPLIGAHGQTKNPKIIMIIAPKKFADQEFFEPKSIFEKNGAKVWVASTDLQPAVGYGIQTVKPDLTIASVKSDDYDAIVIIGGEGAIDFLWDNKELRLLVKDAYAKNKMVAAICAAPVVLARAGLLQGKAATVYPDPGFITELTKNGADYQDTKVVVSGKIITGNGPSSSTDFGLKVWEELSR